MPRTPARRTATASRRAGGTAATVAAASPAPGGLVATMTALHRTAGGTAVAALVARSSPSGAPAASGATATAGRRFAPFRRAATPQNVSVASLAPLDTLGFRGLTYPEGCTTGNDVRLEQLFRQTGGGSEPGYPKGFEEIRLVDQYLLHENRPQVATAMHAINGDFVAGANNTDQNIFMGTAKANKTHLNEVEAPLRQALQGRTASGRAARYEAALAAHPPVALAADPAIIAWDAPGADIPGATEVSGTARWAPTPLTRITHYVDTARLAAAPTEFPRIVDYSVVPEYKPDRLPAYVDRNIAEAEVKITEAEAELAGLTDPAERDELAEKIKNERWAVERLRLNGPRLFPTAFTAEATYYLASYAPDRRWLVGRDAGTFDAQE
ncbi:hypothetical protein ACGFLS_26970 [Streptomyces abikoensis]|uniref:hypothetical protein n=1 Tax=Streptomyces abikoensis TaxID=97398 RepID=UPI00371248B8